MIIFITIVYTALLTLLYQKKVSKTISPVIKAKQKNAYINWMFVFLIIVAGLRNVATGPDTYAYYCTFVSLENQTLSKTIDDLIAYLNGGPGKDMGYAVLQKLFQLLCPSFRLFLFFIAIIFYSGVAYITRQCTHSVTEAFLSIILFVTLFQIYAFSAVRQDFAMGLTMWSYMFVRKRKLIPFLTLVIIGSLVHKSCLLFIPYYWIANVRKEKLLATMAVCLIPVLFVFARPLTGFLVSTSVGETYAHYYEAGKEAGTPVFTAMLVLSFVFYLVMLSKLARKYPQSHFFTNSIYLTVGFLPVTWVVPDFMRILLYFSVFLPLILANCINIVKDKVLRSFIIVGFMSISLYLFVKTYPPYDFFWNEMELGSNYSVSTTTQWK